MGKGLIGACVQENQVLLVNNVEEETRLLRQVDHESGYRTEQVLCVPLLAEGSVIGALQLLNKPAGFTETDAGLLGLLGHFAASAIDSERLRQENESARLVKHELALAHDVQARLLPDRPLSINGLDCVGFCRPARSIGGDYYDLLSLKDGKFALTLGDVSGKGIPAAVMMASIQTLLRTLLQQDALHLASVLTALNQTMYETSTPERYSTLFCGVVSEDRSTLTYVNAGHTLPMLLRGDGGVDRLAGGGPPLALLPGISYTQIDTRLEPADTLVVFSDGIVEACNHAGEFWEEEELERFLLSNPAAPLAQLPDLLCAAADNFAAGAEQYDDMTIAALRIL